MSGSMDLDRQLTGRLAERFEARATSHEPDGLLESTLARVATTRQRPRWRAAERWTPMTTLAIPVRPTVRMAWLVGLLLVILALVAAVLIGTGHHGVPSNGRILFGENGNIIELKPDGTTAAVVSGTDRNVGVSWAPDGTRAAFWRATSDGSALWMLPATASKPVPVTAQQFHPTFGETEVISWSPDGTRVAFGSTPSGNADDPGPSSILVVDVGTGAVTQLPRADLLAADMPTWSRDGTMIAFRGQVDASGAGHRLSVMNADGSRVRRISDALADGFDAVGYGSPTWSPDGRSIVFDAINSSGRTTAFRLYRADLAAGTVSQLTTQPRNAYAPRYSPDGSLVAFTDWQEPVSSLWVMRPDGNGKLDLADGSVSDSSQWSPDGQWILYEGQPANGHDNSLYRIRPDKTGRQVLLDVPSAANPRSGVSWQPVP